MTAALDDARPVGRAGTGLHAHQACGEVGEEGSHLIALKLASKDCPAIHIDTMELERVLCQVYADDGNVFHGMASFEGCLSGDSSLPWLEGRGHPITYENVCGTGSTVATQHKDNTNHITLNHSASSG